MLNTHSLGDVLAWSVYLALVRKPLKAVPSCWVF